MAVAPGQWVTTASVARGTPNQNCAKVSVTEANIPRYDIVDSGCLYPTEGTWFSVPGEWRHRDTRAVGLQRPLSRARAAHGHGEFKD